MALMNKIVNSNENFKTCKEILDEKSFYSLKRMIDNVAEQILTTNKNENNLNQILKLSIFKYNEISQIMKNITIYGEEINQISYDIVENQKHLFNRQEYNIEPLETLGNLESKRKKVKERVLENYDITLLKPNSLKILIEKMVNNYRLNYFWNYLLILEMIIINFYKILIKNDIKYNYQLKNSSFIFILLKTIWIYISISRQYYEYVVALKNQNNKYNIYFINTPDIYAEIWHYLDKEILKRNNNLCYCESEIKIDNKFNTIKFNLLFTGF